MLIFENKDLPGLSLFLSEQTIEFRRAVSHSFLGQQFTLCCSGLRYKLSWAS